VRAGSHARKVRELRAGHGGLSRRLRSRPGHSSQLTKGSYEGRFLSVARKRPRRSCGGAPCLSRRRTSALLLAAEIQGEQNQVDAMVHLAGRALAASPGNAEALAYLAEASLRREDYAEALRRADAVLSRAPSETRAMEVRAIARAQTGDRKGARELFESLCGGGARSLGAPQQLRAFRASGKRLCPCGESLRAGRGREPKERHGLPGASRCGASSRRSKESGARSSHARDARRILRPGGFSRGRRRQESEARGMPRAKASRRV